MPISVGLVLNGMDLKLPDIGPLDPPGSFTHHDPEQPRIVVVSCNPVDDGGIVYETTPDNSILLAKGLLRALTDGDDVVIEAVIEESGFYERDLLTKHGLGHLTLRHYE